MAPRPVRECHNSRSSHHVSDKATCHFRAGRICCALHQMRRIQSGSVLGVNRAAPAPVAVVAEANSDRRADDRRQSQRMGATCSRTLSSDPVSGRFDNHSPDASSLQWKSASRRLRPVQSRCRFQQRRVEFIPRSTVLRERRYERQSGLTYFANWL